MVLCARPALYRPLQPRRRTTKAERLARRAERMRAAERERRLEALWRGRDVWSATAEGKATRREALAKVRPLRWASNMQERAAISGERIAS